MRVTQKISIGTLRINSMSNSSIVQVGTSGSIKSHAEDIKEYIPQQQAHQKLESKITKEVKPILNKEGLPVKEAAPFPPNAGTGNGMGDGYSAVYQTENGTVLNGDEMTGSAARKKRT
ncbi:hypothetical protein OS242_08655 [Tumebacillus sp. DT12]|uniref:Uncharacterized protein n=1 Tax=Tumebacillus lacus TaxID=2995335 RepID=A0ABT3X5P2_9BACL|nr:spore germination protein GerPB [Tumebacillus lacus]MCX7570034.1 hypothetical protein [Tumebacillus lacus]